MVGRVPVGRIPNSLFLGIRYKQKWKINNEKSHSNSKGGDRDQVSNYKLISMLPLLCNVCKELLIINLITFKSKTCMLSSNRGSGHIFPPKALCLIAFDSIWLLVVRILDLKKLLTILIIKCSQNYRAVGSLASDSNGYIMQATHVDSITQFGRSHCYSLHAKE